MPEPFEDDRDHIGVHKQADDLNYVGVKSVVDRVPGSNLVKFADIAERHGVSRVRIAIMKELILLGVTDDQINSPLVELDKTGLSAEPSAFRRGILACTGLEPCKLALVTTCQYATDLVGDLEERLGDLDVPTTIVSDGCPNACARIQIAGTGLKG